MDLVSQLIAYLSARPGLRALLPQPITREWPSQAARVPYVCMTQAGGSSDFDFDGYGGVDSIVVRVDVYAGSAQDCAALADELDAELNGFARRLAGMDVHELRRQSRMDLGEQTGDRKRWRIALAYDAMAVEVRR